MKHILLAALALAALPLAGFAQSSAVPLRISFQSRVTDAAGTPIGNTTPVNRTVTLRIWDNPTATATTNRLYSESQTVTIANGEFSLLVGSGTAVTNETNTSTLDAVFNGDLRYLGVTIDDGTTAADPEVTPRQQIVTAPYAFRAKVAESVLGAAITTAMIANNAVNTVQIADNAITTAKIAAGTIVTADIADNAITADKLAENSITTADIQANAVTAAKIGSDVGVWSTNGTNLANVSRATGNVGVGTTTPTALISAGAAVANSKIAVYDNGSTLRGGFGWQNNQFRLHLSSASDKFSFLNGESGTEIATLQGNGNLVATTFTGNGTIPIGGIIMWSGTTSDIPAGWTLCNGVASNGQTPPDLRDRFIVGAGTSYNPKATGGATTHALAATNLPTFSITYSDIFYSESGGTVTVTSNKGSGDSDSDNKGWAMDRTATRNGDAAAIDHRPPYMALCYIMRVQ